DLSDAAQTLEDLLETDLDAADAEPAEGGDEFRLAQLQHAGEVALAHLRVLGAHAADVFVIGSFASHEVTLLQAAVPRSAPGGLALMRAGRVRPGLAPSREAPGPARLLRATAVFRWKGCAG